MSAAGIVKVCVSRQPLVACWSNAGVLTPIIAHYPYDGDGNPLPIGNTGNDGATLIQPEYTDLQNNLIAGINPADVTLGKCGAGTCEEGGGTLQSTPLSGCTAVIRKTKKQVKKR